MFGGLSPGTTQLIATAIFAIAVLHTFSTRLFEHLAHIHPRLPSFSSSW
jgi:hypothetical protein